MILKHQKDINSIDNCPSNSEDGERKLFRFVKGVPLSNKSFAPYGVTNKKKYSEVCIAWGLSTYKTLFNAECALKNLPKAVREKFVAIAEVSIDDADGVKYQSGKNQSHYTFFPEKTFDLLTEFSIVKKL